MRHLCRYVVAPLLLLALVAPIRAEKVERLRPAGYVNDFATGAQIAVVIIISLEGVEAADFGSKLFAQRGNRSQGR